MIATGRQRQLVSSRVVYDELTPTQTEWRNGYVFLNTL